MPPQSPAQSISIIQLPLQSKFSSAYSHDPLSSFASGLKLQAISSVQPGKGTSGHASHSSGQESEIGEPAKTKSQPSAATAPAHPPKAATAASSFSQA